VAAIEGKIFHDLRGTTIRNMLRAGVSERVAMLVAGYKTRSMLDRYDILNEGDLQEAAERIAGRHRDRPFTYTVMVDSSSASSRS
jgi:hypothetical protein